MSDQHSYDVTVSYREHVNLTPRVTRTVRVKADNKSEALFIAGRAMGRDPLATMLQSTLKIEKVERCG